MGRRVGGVGEAALAGVPAGADGEAERRPEGVRRAQQGADIGGFGDALHADAEIAPCPEDWASWPLPCGRLCLRAMTDATDAQLAAQDEAYPYPQARPARRGQAADRRQPGPSARGGLLGVRRPPAGEPAAECADRRRRHGRRHHHARPADGARRAARHRDVARPLGRRREHRAGAGRGARARLTSSGNAARCSTCRARGSARSTTSIAAACCTTCPTRPPGSTRCSRCWRPAAGSG